MAEPKLEADDHRGEFSDGIGFGANVAQALDQGVSIFGSTASRILPGTRANPFPKMPMIQTPGVQHAFNGIGAITGAYSAWQGAHDMMDETKTTADRVNGGANVVSGGIGAVSGVAGSAGASTGFLGGLANVGGQVGLGAEAFAGSTWGAGAGGVAAGAGTALATAGAVLGAGTAGYGVGRYGDRATQELGWLRDDHGRPTTISDWGSGLAANAEEGVTNLVGGEQGSMRRSLGSGLGAVAGGLTSLGTSVAGVPIAIGATGASVGKALGQGISNRADDLARWISE